MLDDKTLGFADFGGNKQYIMLENPAENDKATLFLMDYAQRQRIKVRGRAQLVEDDRDLIQRLRDPGYRALPERAILFEVAAWDVNCRQHIVQRFDEATVALVTRKLTDRIAALEAEVA